MENVGFSTITRDNFERDAYAAAREEVISERKMQIVEAPFAEYRDNPVGFAKDILRVRKFYPWQTDILDAIAEYDRVAVRKANGIGGTTCASWATIWFLLTRFQSMVPTTAGRETQVREILWTEIAKWIAPIQKYVDLTSTKMTVRKTERVNWPKWFAKGFTASVTAGQEQSPAGEGWHAPFLLFIADEARAIPDVRWESMTASLTSEESKVLATSVTGPSTGWFYKCFTDFREHWKTIHAFSAEKVDGNWTSITHLVSQDSIDEKLLYGENDPWFVNRVRAEFTSQDTWAGIALDWIEDAKKSTLTYTKSDPEELGVDVARFGKNRVAFVLRRGPVVLKAWEVPGKTDTMFVAGLIVKETQRNPDIVVKIDEGGVGGGVVDRLNELKREEKISANAKIFGIDAGRSPRRKERYVGLRDELWGIMRDRLREKRVSFAPVANDRVMDRLASQLTAIRVEQTSDGRERFETKQHMIKRGIDSPDIGDALNLAFLPGTGPVVPKGEHEERGKPRTANLKAVVF